MPNTKTLTKKDFRIQDSPTVEKLLGGGLQDIPVDMDRDQCVKKFLSRYVQAVEPYEEYASGNNRLDYLLMKRFIFTAYTNLVEMDHSISEGRVKRPKEILMFVQKYYNELQQVLNRPADVNYEIFFLKKQTAYNEVVEAYEDKKEELQYLESRIAQIRVSMDEYGRRLRLTSKKSPEFAEIEQIYKRLNGENVDCMHEQGKIKNDMAKLHQAMEVFKKSQAPAFSQYFYEKVEDLSDFMLEILNGLSCEYDTQLWEEAKESEVIRKFFAEAKVQGSFSSKTYLKYFLKHLNETMMSEQQERLVELLKYLEEISKRNIFILGKDTDQVTRLKQLVEGIDKEYVVATAISSERIFVEHQRQPFDLIVMDYSLRQINGLELLGEFWKGYPDAKENVPVLMRFEEPTYEDVDRAGRFGVRYFIRANARVSEFVDKVKAIL